MNPFDAVVRRVLRGAGQVVGDVRRQAPGARMVGEFTVRHLVREMRRRVEGGRGGGAPPRDDGGRGA